MRWYISITDASKASARQRVVEQLFASGKTSRAKRVAAALEQLVAALPGELDGDVLIETDGDLEMDGLCEVRVAISAKSRKSEEQKARESEVERQRAAQERLDIEERVRKAAKDNPPEEPPVEPDPPEPQERP
jgi:hypothetical protein